MPTENENQSAQVSGVPPPTACSVSKWKDGIHKENGETYYYTKYRRFVLRMTDDSIGHIPVWVYESSSVPCQACDGTQKPLVGNYGVSP